MSAANEEFLFRELRSAVLGELLGQGTGRQVYLCKVNSDLVVKIEENSRSFQNVEEWQAWDWVSRGGAPDMAQWLAPCEFISNSGSVLVQRRVEPLRRGDLPAKVPAYLADLKLENFGMLNGRVVCCDYGTIGVALRRTDKRLVKADWR